MRLSTRGRFAITAMIDLASRQTPATLPRFPPNSPFPRLPTPTTTGTSSRSCATTSCGGRNPDLCGAVQRRGGRAFDDVPARRRISDQPRGNPHLRDALP